MSLPSKGFSQINNGFLMNLLPRLPLAEAIQLYLHARGRLRRRGAGLGELITVTGDRDARHTERSAQRLVQTGMLAKVEGLYYAPAFAPAQITAQTPAPTPAQKTAQNPAPIPARTSNSHIFNAVPDEENAADFPPEEGEEGEEVIISSLLALVDVSAGAQAGEPETEPEQTEEQGPDGPAADAAPEQVLPSQDFEKDAGEASKSGAKGTGEYSAAAATPAAADIGDAAALKMFDAIAGYGFCATYRLHLLRWFEAYSAEFLRLSWQLAPTIPGIKIPATAFVWLLNREREWPPALRSQYERDFKAQQDAIQAVQARPVVRPGDLLRWPDGFTAVVQRVDRADAVTDAESNERGYVSLSLIGRGVEVLHS